MLLGKATMGSKGSSKSSLSGVGYTVLIGVTPLGVTPMYLPPHPYLQLFTQDF